MKINLIELFEESARKYPQKTAVIDKDREINFSCLRLQSMKLAQIIMDAGLLRNIHDIFGLSESEKRKIYSLLRQKTGAPHRQISAFLQLPVEITR